MQLRRDRTLFRLENNRHLRLGEFNEHSIYDLFHEKNFCTCYQGRSAFTAHARGKPAASEPKNNALNRSERSRYVAAVD